MNSSTNKPVYTDVWRVIDDNPHFFLYIFIGGRGCGKTYSVLRGIVERNLKFVYLRRSDRELKIATSLNGNCFKPLNMKEGFAIYPESGSAEEAITFCNENVIDERTNKPAIIGYAGSLSTFGNFRGASFEDVDVLFLDEFINTAPINRLKDSAFQLFNAIETINRNRELEGSKPIYCILCSNSNRLDDDILNTFGLPERIRVMRRIDQEIYTDELRGIYLNDIHNENFKEAKKKTALYKLTQGTEFYDMAVENDFVFDDFNDIQKIPTNKLQPICGYGDLYFYAIKDRKAFYVCKRKADVNLYPNTTEGYTQFKRDYGDMLQIGIVERYLIYSDYNVKISVKNIGKKVKK